MAVAAALLAWALEPGTAQAQPTARVAQTFTLVKGWNAIHVEVQPEPADPATVFAGLPVLSVFTPLHSFTATDFIKDLTEEAVQTPDWLWWYPTAPRSALTNLHSILPNRAYLVHLGDLPAGATQVPLTVAGAPRVEAIDWRPDGFTLTGLPVSAAQPPTFQSFFAPSSAHQGLVAFKLVNGTWQPVVPATDRIRAGVAYQIYTTGVSRYTGTFELDLGGASALDFSETLVEQEMDVKPLTAAAVALRQLPASPARLEGTATAPLPLAYLTFNPSSTCESVDGTRLEWKDLSTTATTVRAAGAAETKMRLAVKRASFTADEHASVLEASDGVTRRLIPIVAERSVPRTGRGTLLPPFAGLWVGTVQVDKVSQPQSGSTTPVAVHKPFYFRLILHVDAANKVRLLKQVIEMWKDGTSTLVNGRPVLDEPGRPVLLTDDSLVSQFTGATLRNGTPVGLRISSPAYDYAGNDLTMTGTVGASQTVSASIVLGRDHPTNPYRHAFHPDHDGLEPDYATADPGEIYQVTRDLQLQFASLAADPCKPPQWGDSLLEGTYREVVRGLHRNPIHVQGTFRIGRRSVVTSLNQ